MGVSPAEVYRNRSSPPSCTGSSIISVMQGVARPFTSQLQYRVDERLSNGSIVIRSLRPEDGGFYVMCDESTSTPVRIILLTVTEPRPAAMTTEPELNHTTHNKPRPAAAMTEPVLNHTTHNKPRPAAAMTEPVLNHTTHNSGGRTHWWVLALVSIAAAAAAGIAMAILLWKCALVEQHVCNGASGRGQAQVEMAVQWAAQHNNGAPGIL
ncbi:uncharacterized protein [Ambystoma mexicanum]|uniref:uncharacterized protein isoform X1 n=1 Tax=Ambystoma mexicanum TaxID=8296 RepID=UPI0037E77EE6